MKLFWVSVGSGILREFEKNRCTVALYSSHSWWRLVPNRAPCDVRSDIWSGFRSVEEKSL